MDGRVLGYTLLVSLLTDLMRAFSVDFVGVSVLYGVSARDPATLVAVSLLFLGAVLLACYGPIRVATKVDPMTALRHEWQRAATALRATVCVPQCKTRGLFESAPVPPDTVPQNGMNSPPILATDVLTITSCNSGRITHDFSRLFQRVS